MTRWWQADNLFSVGFWHGTQTKLVNNFSAFEASKWFQITYTNLQMSWIRIPKHLAPILGKMKDFSATSAITPFRILIFQIDKLLPRGGYDEKSWKTACHWVIMRSFYCPNLVGIGCNAYFLSRFKVINPETLKFTERDKKVFKVLIYWLLFNL